jgi:CIC family chloride channel protein
LGLLGGLTAVAFLETLRGASSLYRRTRLPRPLAMATAGLFLGVVILRYPEVVGNGREAVADLFRHQWGLGHVAVLLGLRLIATPLMVGSGAVGGVFTPTLFLGAMLGHGAGLLVQAVAPGLGAQPGTYALVGMGALLAGTTHAPMTSVLMVFEMTLDYNVVVPLLLAAVASSLVATRLSRDSVYTEALRRKAESPDGEGAVIDVLTVRDVMRQEQVTIAPDLPLPLILDAFVAARRNHLYVVDAQGRFRGAVNLHDVNRELRSVGPAAELRASDLLHSRFETTTPEERLDRVLERFAVQECERLPVLADSGSRLLVGTVSKRDILAVYSLELLQRGGAARTSPAPVDRLVDELEVPDDLVGVSLDESAFRDRHGLSVLMIRRGGGWILPEGPTRFQAGDRLIVFGPRERLADYRRTRAGGEARG